MDAPDNSTPDKSTSASTSDAELLRQGNRGDPAAQQALVDRHARYLFGVAHALSGNSADAEDLVQETFLGALKTRFRGESTMRTWLVRILTRRAGMLRRKRKHDVRNVSIDVAGEAGASSQRGSDRSEAAEAKIDLTTMLAMLSPEHRQVIVLRELQQLSYEQIAEAIGVPRGTVESRLHRAREELRKKFGSSG